MTQMTQPPPAPLVPAEFAVTADGTPYAPAFDDIYHSVHGGAAQARHVFLAGNELPARWRQRAAKEADEAFVIVETGFGLGLNFLVTWQAWREAGAPCPLHFVSVEKHPFRRDDLARALAGFAADFVELAPLVAALLAQWPPLLAGFHRLHVDNGRVTLTLLFGDAASQLPKLAARADALYLDGFAPAKNPALWSTEVLAALNRLSHTGTTLATWSVAGELRRSLQTLGWMLIRRPGFAGKREMLCGRYAAPQRTAAGNTAVSPTPTFVPRHAIVIGAGIAGAAIAERLAQRGWRVTLCERQPAPAQAASGNPVGVLLPLLARDDAPGAQLSRACYLYALRRLAALPAVRWSPCGVLQIADDDTHAEQQRALIAKHGWPADYAAFLDQTAAEALVGRPLVHGGVHFPGGGWVDPRSLCQALLAAGGERIITHYGVDIARLEHGDDGWQVFDATGQRITSAPHVILANAQDAAALLASSLPYPLPLTLTPIRGQISFLPQLAGDWPPPRTVLCRSGYLAPLMKDDLDSNADGGFCVGASFDRDDNDLTPRLADHAGNLQRLEELLPGAAQGIDAGSLRGRVGIRAATRDRLPLVGPLPAPLTARQATQVTLATLPRLPGLHVLLGLGARGMVWAPLAAEHLASQLCGEPSPLERPLARLLDPARFYLHALRRQTAPAANL